MKQCKEGWSTEKGAEKAETAGRTAFVKENKASNCKLLHHGICHPLEREVYCPLLLLRSNTDSFRKHSVSSYRLAFDRNSHFASACSIAI